VADETHKLIVQAATGAIELAADWDRAVRRLTAGGMVMGFPADLATAVAPAVLREAANYLRTRVVPPSDFAAGVLDRLADKIRGGNDG
jgi:hypothetical protein